MLAAVGASPFVATVNNREDAGRGVFYRRAQYCGSLAHSLFPAPSSCRWFRAVLPVRWVGERHSRNSCVSVTAALAQH